MPALFQSILVAIVGFFVAFFSVFGLNTHEATAPSERPPAIIAETKAEPRPEPEPETPKTSVQATPEKTPTPASVPAPATTPTATVSVAEVPAPAPKPPATGGLLSPSALNETVRKSVVNIFCTSLFGGPFEAVTASGVVIDPRGVILTNAHVAQYFLLRDYPTPNTLSCVVRIGAPAVPMYTAELLFLPPSWIQKNANKIREQNPLGTGEHDYALVRITGVVNNQNALPSAFPYLPISTALPALDDDILVVGYPAGFLDGITLQRGLYQTSAFTKVRELLTFVESTLDLFSIGGSVVAQSGASGGAATNMRGELMGIVVTSTEASDTSSRDLRAITMSYFFRDFESEANESFESFIAADPAQKAALFRGTEEQAEIDTLVSALENN